jgi:hypothetical protein
MRVYAGLIILAAYFCHPGLDWRLYKENVENTVQPLKKPTHFIPALAICFQIANSRLKLVCNFKGLSKEGG